MSTENLPVQEWHKKQAIDNFNYTWALIDKKERTVEDNVNMIHAAHASRFHWGQVGTPLHFARGEWQISRVYSLLNMTESALFHGEQSLNLCLENNIADFDLAFAYEALARSYKLSNNTAEMKKYYHLALSAADNIEKQENKDYFLSELNSIK